ncbi:capping protein-inhibiting regulator of actin dynamics isoform X2 [Brienomyrus brachyistius]|nr:capping protein-inhibiting regulator of actin dynamics isoform X2 [Brienomyrus brachyistius]
MASGPDVTGSQEPSDALVDCPGKKKSKFQTFKNFFVRKKRKGGDAPLGEAVLKASHSSDNVSDAKPTAAGGAETDADAGQKVSMGNKAKSHDSVFVTDSPASDGSDDLTSTQDSVQEKLQLKQGSRQATPITLIGVRKDDDPGAVSEDDGLPCSPPEISTLHAVLADSSHKPSNSVQRRSSLSQEGSDTDDDQMSFEASSRPVSPPHYLFVDLGCPVTPSSCLDTSAARHRIAVKNRACAKRKPASREFLDSGRERDLSGKVPGRGIENELGDDTPEPTSAEENSKDFSVQQMDSAERTSEEWQLLAEEVQLVPKEVPPVEQSVPEEEPPMLEEPAGFHQWPRIEYEEQNAVDESSCCEDAPFPPSCSLSSSFVDPSQEFLLDPYSETQKHWGNRSLLTGSQESLDSLELPAENDTNAMLELGCEAPVEESGSLLQEVLSSLEKPLASGLMLGPDAEDQEMEKVGESAEKVSTCQGEESLPSSPTSQHEPVAQGGDRTSYIAADQEEDESSASVQGEEHSEDKGHAELVEVSDEDSKEAKSLVVEPTMSTGGEKHKENEEEAEEEEDDDHDEGDDEMNAEVASETQDHECPVGVEGLDTHQQPEANTQAVVGLDSEGDGKPSSDEAVQVSSQGDEDYVKPSKESLSITDRVEPEQLIPSTEEPGQDIINLSSRASISPQHNEEDDSVKEDSGKHPVRFTIAPAWHRSLSGDGFKEAYCHAHSIAAKASEACAEIKSEAGTPPKADIGDSWSHSSASLSPVRDQDLGAAETPFGVRLRKTSLRGFCYGTEDSGEPPGTPSEPPKAPCPEFPNSKPVLPRKPELLEDDVAKFRRTAEPGAGQSPGGSLASPSWVYVAKQKQKIFRENSLEESPGRKDPFEKDAACRKNLSVFPKSTSKDQARISNPNATGLPPTAPCSLEISNPASSDKDGKRAVMSASPAALGPEEPPWLALAKKKAKAWSEMPQMVQ